MADYHLKLQGGHIFYQQLERMLLEELGSGVECHGNELLLFGKSEGQVETVRRILRDNGFTITDEYRLPTPFEEFGEGVISWMKRGLKPFTH